MAQYKKLIACPACGQNKTHYALGKCEACYTRENRKRKKEITPAQNPQKELRQRLESWLTS